MIKIKGKVLVYLLVMLVSPHVAAYGKIYGENRNYSPDPLVPANSVEPDGPSKILRQGFAQLRSLFKNGQPNRKNVESFVNDALSPYFDFKYMTRWAAGPLYKKLSQKQKRKMRRHLQQSFLSILVKNLASYQSQSIKVMPARPGKSDKEVLVTVWVKKLRARPVKVNFRFYFNGKAWKVFDVAANGSSAVLHYRQHFARQYRKNQQQKMMRQRRQNQRTW